MRTKLELNSSMRRSTELKMADRRGVLMYKSYLEAVGLAMVREQAFGED